MITKEIAQVLLQFMSRVQLTGSEVAAFNTVVAELGKIVNPVVQDTTETETSNG